MNKSKNVVPHLILLYIIWGFNWVVMRMANDYFPPTFFVACRFFIGAVALLLVCALRKSLIPPKQYWPWIAATGVLMMSLNNLMVQIATSYIGAGLTALLDYMQAIFVCVLAAFILGERFTFRKGLGIVLSVAGLIILMKVDTVDNVWGVVLALGAAVVWAVSNIIVKHKLQGCDMLQYTGWQMACGSAVMIMYLFIAAPDALHEGMEAVAGAGFASTFGLGTLLYNGLVASAFAFVLWNTILTNMEAGQASIAVMAVPAVGVLSGVIVLHEPMSWSIAFGMLLIFAGVLTVLGLGERKHASEGKMQ